MTCPNSLRLFDASVEDAKNQFIESVFVAYNDFIAHNIINSEEDQELREKSIRKKVKHELKQERKIRRWERINERIYNKMFEIENEICEEIQGFYGDICDIDLTSEWYIVDDMIYITLTFAEFEVKIWNDSGKPRLDGCPKNLKRFLKDIDCIHRFIEVDNEYGERYDKYCK
jgi:hypothetical protein